MLAAAALTPPLAWEFPYAMVQPLKKKKKVRRQEAKNGKKKYNPSLFSELYSLREK